VWDGGATQVAFDVAQGSGAVDVEVDGVPDREAAGQQRGGTLDHPAAVDPVEAFDELHAVPGIGAAAGSWVVDVFEADNAQPLAAFCLESLCRLEGHGPQRCQV